MNATQYLPGGTVRPKVSDTGVVQWNPAFADPKPNASASVIGNFSCGASGGTDQIFNLTGTNQTLVEADSGKGGYTTLGTLEAAAAAFVKTYAETNGNINAATAAANKTVEERRLSTMDGEQPNNDGDRIISRKKR